MGNTLSAYYYLFCDRNCKIFDANFKKPTGIFAILLYYLLILEKLFDK